MLIPGFSVKSYFYCLSFLLLFVIPVNYAGAITLDEAYEAALEMNEEIHESLQQRREAKAGITEAKSRLYPHLDLSASKVRQKELSQLQSDPTSPTGFSERTFQPQNNHQFEVELRHRLYTGGKTWSGWTIREIEALEESLRHYRRKQEVLFDVARRYYGVLLARRNLEIARNTLSRSRNQLERAKGRREVGEITRTGVLRAEVSVSRAEQELQRSENELTVAREELSLAMGSDTVPESVEPVDFRSLPDSGVEHYYRLAFENRRDLKQARTRQEVTYERVQWERADYYPNISFVSSFQERDEPRFSDETENWSMQLVGSYPIFSGWQQTSEVKQARSRHRAAEARFDRMKKQVRVEIKNLYLDLRTQAQVIETAEDEVASARENYERISAEFDQGLASSVDVNDALTALQEAESRLANARYNFQLGLLQLELSSGIFQESRLRSRN